MKPEYALLYEDMLQDIRRVQAQHPSEKQGAEAAFWITVNYATQLKKLVLKKGFSSEAEEMEFFREIKPVFLQWADYFVILSEALVCVPLEPGAEVHYWSGELGRIQRFFGRNGGIIGYLESDSRVLDTQYFLRTGEAEEKTQGSAPPPFYDNDPDFYTLHDRTVTLVLAYQRYLAYCQQKITALNC